jgi:hypothetical protein
LSMNLKIHRETFATPEDHTWLKTGNGTKTADSITLAGAAFASTFADGFIPSGVCLGKATSGTYSGFYIPYDNAGSDGEQTARYLLFTSIQLKLNDAGTAFENSAAAGMWEGDVIEANLPTDHGVDSAAKTDLARIRFS